MDRRPNILWFISDDTNHKMLSCYGGKVLSPNIDSIASNGVKFNNFYCASSACTPSRYNYLSGHYGSRCPGSVFQSQKADEPRSIFFNTDLEPDLEKSVAAVMQENKYFTGFVGKWHVGGSPEDLSRMPKVDEDADPLDAETDKKMREHQKWLCDMIKKTGFDYAASAVWGNHSNIPEKAKNHNLEWTCKGALDFLERAEREGKPFFLNVASTTIHGPDHAQSLMANPYITAGGYSDSHLGCMPDRKSIYERIRNTGDVDYNSTTSGVLWMDDLVGAVIGKVREMGLEDNTVIIFSTDHGFSGGKFSVYEAGGRIPFLIQWKKHFPEGTEVEGEAQNVDFFPTIMDVAGIKADSGVVLDGQSMLPLITADKKDIHDGIYSEFGYTRAFKLGKWKYIAWRLPSDLINDMKSGKTECLCTHFGRPIPNDIVRSNLMTPLILNMPHYFDPEQLYDLEKDPYEKHNLAEDPAYAEKLSEMKKRLGQHLLGIGQENYPLDEVDSFYYSDCFSELKENALSVLRKGEEKYFEIAAFGGFYQVTRDFYGLDDESK